MNGVSFVAVDIITLAFARGIMQMVLGGLLLYLGTRQTNDQAAKWWALGFFINGVSLMVFSLNLPESWELGRNVLNHLSLSASAVFFLLGFWRFGQQPTQTWLLMLLMAFPLVSIVAWEVVWPNARYRVLCTATGYVVFLLALQHSLSQPVRAEVARIYRRLRLVVLIYLLIFVWSYASIAELLPTSARQSLDYHRAIFSISSLLFMLAMAVGCLALKFGLLAARNSDLAMRDWLTNLLNRRGFFMAMAELNNNPDHETRVISLMAIDIDHFKRINDSVGHAAGDRVLQHFAELLNGHAAENRLISRMGGEEFLVTVFDVPASAVTALAEEIRAQAEMARVAIDNQQTTAFTVSIGVYQMADDESIERALAQADQALYAAKHRGRNQVAVNINESNRKGTHE